MNLDPNETSDTNSTEGSMTNEIPIPNEEPTSNNSGDFYPTEGLNQNPQSNNYQGSEIMPNINYGQENMYQQPQYENNQQSNDFQQMNTGGAGQNGDSSKKKNKKRNTIIIGIISVLAIALIAVIYFLSSNPKAKMTKAMEKTYDSYVGIFDKRINFDAIKTMGKNKDLYAGYKFTLNGISGDVDSDVLNTINTYLSGMELSIENTINEKEKKQSGNFSFKISDFEVNTNYFATNDMIGISIPEFYDRTLTFDTKDFSDKFNDSEFREYLGLEKMDEDFNLNVFDDEIVKDDDTQKIKKDLKTIYNNMIVKDKGKVKKEINGKSLRCTKYQAIILSEDIQALISDLADLGETSDVKELEEALKNDIVFTVYVYKNKMVAFQSSYEVQVDGESATLNVNIDYSKSKILGTIEMKDSINTVAIVMENNISDTESDFDITVKENEESVGTASLTSKLDGDNISINGDILASNTEDPIVTLKCEGSLSNVKKGKSYSINLDTIEFSIANLITFDMSAEVNVNSDGTIVIPGSEDSTKVFEMTKQDMDELLTEIQTKVLENESLLNLIGSITSYTSSEPDTYDDPYGDDIYDEDYNEPTDNDSGSNGDNNIITLKDYEGNEIKLLCSDETASIESDDSYAFAVMNNQKYYASFFVNKGDNIEDIFNDEFDYYIENYDAEVSDLQTCNGYNYKIMSYKSDEYTLTNGYAVIQIGDYYIAIDISLGGLSDEESIDDAVQFVLNNLTIIE